MRDGNQVEKTESVVQEDSFEQAVAELANIEIADEVVAAEENVDLTPLLPYIMPVVTMMYLNLSSFEGQVDKFIVEGPNAENLNGAGLIDHIIKTFYESEENVSFLTDLIPARFVEYTSLIQAIVRPQAQEVMANALQKLLNKYEQELNEEQVAIAIEEAKSKSEIEVELDDLKRGLVLVQIYLNNANGECKLTPKSFLVPAGEVEALVAEYKDKAGFIKTLTDSKSTHDFFPPKKELIKGLSEAAKIEDAGLLALCIHNNKLPIEIFYEIFAKGRFDILGEMIQNKYFGFGNEEVVKVDERDGNGLTALMKACRDGDAVKAKTLLAMGANPTLTDVEGNNALMYAVTYSEEQIAEVNKPSGAQSTETKELKDNKNSIIAALLKDKRLNLEAVNKTKHTALQIAITQGMIKGARNLSELRGDHGSMEQLIAAGADPVFGEFELSFRAKTFMTLGLSIGLTFAKNQLLNYTGIGFFGRFLFYPVIRIIDCALDAVVGYKAYLDAKNPLYKACRTFLDTEYAADTLLNMDKKVLIGAYHITWTGKVVCGEELKNYMGNHVGYRNISQGYFSIKDIPTTNPESQEFKMTKRVQLEMAEILFSRYYRIQESLKNHWMAPWTREAMEKLAVEIAEAHAKTKFGYEITDGFSEKIKATFNESNHAALVKEIAESPESRALFYKIHSAVKSGALFVDIETRYNLEKFEQKLHNPELLKRSFMAYAAELANGKVQPTSVPTFAEFADFCKSLKSEDVEFETSLEIILEEFSKDLENDREHKTFFERVKDAAASFTRGAMDKVVSGVAYVGGYERRDVYHGMAEVLSSVGATGNAAGHIAFREFYDSNYFLPTLAAAGCAYALYKWPRQAWAATKFCFSALTTVCSLTFQALALTFNLICAVFSYSAQAVKMVGEYINDFAHSVQTYFKAPSVEGESSLKDIIGPYTALIVTSNVMNENNLRLVAASAA